MSRLLPLGLLSMTLLTTSCKKEDPKPEPEGALEGNWRVRTTEAVAYDEQGRVLRTYDPDPTIAGYSLVIISSNELKYVDSQGFTQSVTPYSRNGDQLICLPPERSYTIRKVTVRELVLHLKGEYLQFGTSKSRVDFTVHFNRQ